MEKYDAPPEKGGGKKTQITLILTILLAKIANLQEYVFTKNHRNNN